MKNQKYRKGYHAVPIINREWPDKEITKAPVWCSVDLRDGNQALITPMDIEEKLKFFQFLVKLGFKEIEVAFPAASVTESTFVRRLIDENLIPDDVTIQVLTQSRPHIIEETIKSIKGAKNVIVHLYNSTSVLQRKVVFGMDRDEVIKLAVEGAKLIDDLCGEMEGNIRYEYSPESFTGTEMEFAAEICNAVLDVWKPTPEKKVIINLPSTVEIATPNIYADQVEYISKSLKYRDSVTLSVHAHNDRGCGIAASELSLLAGAQRVEGTLFGNGERTGNADIMVMALNMYSQGIDSGLKFDSMDEIITQYEEATGIDIHPRHPYAGELVYTAFSGSHQDAIKKGMDAYIKSNGEVWENPYLPIDPEDLGRAYEPVRINSQSGKSGIAFVLQNKFGIIVPKQMIQEFSYAVTDMSDKKHSELSPGYIYNMFRDEYVNRDEIISLVDYEVTSHKENTKVYASMVINGQHKTFAGEGNGPLDAMSDILRNNVIEGFEIAGYHEHALRHGSASEAMAYISIKDNNENICWGAGNDTNISTASIKALLSAANRYLKTKS